jgi:hypothetical protein
MPNNFGLAGAQPQKQTKFAPIYTGRWSSGIWTNRSPLRDANTSRLVEKFYGAAGDALIAGSNVEITNRLTLARRPGNSVFDTVNSYSNVQGFYDFRVFSSTDEDIQVMIDQSDALYALFNAVKAKVWDKQTGAGQSFMQSVGNNLFWGDGASNKKWLQSLVQWSEGAQWNTPSTAFLSTFLIDPHGNIQQLTPVNFPVTNVQVSGNVLTVTSSASLSGAFAVGMNVQFPASMTASFLEFQTVTITNLGSTTFTANFVNADYIGTETDAFMTQASGGVNPASGTTPPAWSTQVPSLTNGFQGGLTQDGMVQWTNRGNPVQNWGIAAPSSTLSPTIGTSHIAWQAGTFYSGPGVIVDPNGNLQQVAKPGKSGATAPSWSNSLHALTTDGTVTWIMIQTAGSLAWQPNTSYNTTQVLTLTSVSAASGGSTIYNGSLPNTTTNAYVGLVFVVSGFNNAENNGTFVCSASTASSLTLSNTSAVAETTQGQATSNPSYVIGNAVGTNCLFAPGAFNHIALTGNVSAYYFGGHSGSVNVGCFVQTFPTSLGSATDSYSTLNSFSFQAAGTTGDGDVLGWNTVNGAGAVVGVVTPFPSQPTHDYDLIILGTLEVPVAGQYAFNIKHHDGMFWGIGNGATLVSGPSPSSNAIGQTATAAQGFPSFGGQNNIGLQGGQVLTDNYVVNFPTAGTYPVEIDYAYWFHSGIQLNVTCNGLVLPNGNPTSGANPPIWPAWSTSFAPQYPSISETNGIITWFNYGPVTDFAWSASTNITLPGTRIIDTNSNYEFPYRTGITGATSPTFGTGLNSLTNDNPNLIWINQGAATVVSNGTMSAFNGGFRYSIALVNTLDNTVSNATPLSQTTGNFVGADGLTFAPGQGLNLNAIDPQADYVAFFRTTDGESTPFLIPGTFTTYTVPLAEYLVSGYVDDTPDVLLNNLIQAPIAGQNTPPAIGAQNLTYHLNRIWYSIGNVVYWTAGPDTPCGNGVNGTPPLNFDSFPSLVKRIVPTTSGALVFTVSDVYIIQGDGTAQNPIKQGKPLLQGIGLPNYDALDVNGSIIGFFTTDKQFIIIDPNAGVSNVGFPIGDQLRGWDSNAVHVAWHVNGEDQGWYVADGSTGWYRLMTTPAPETGYTWSPFANIQGGCGVVKSIETAPGTHNLLVAPTGSGSILKRDLSYFMDNQTPYAANAIIGSAVLAQPGQTALVSFLATDSVLVGTPLTLGIIYDEAVPYYTGEFLALTVSDNEPPGLTPSTSINGQRFFVSELFEQAAAECRHIQMQVNWIAENQPNELLTLTVFGGYKQEA